MTDTNEVCHYLEAAPDNAATGTLAWASSEDYRDTNIEGTVTAIGGGRKNTALILAIDEDAPAAKACADYRGPNNLADWFLPSTNEQIALYNGRTYVGNMTAATYWSSTQTYIFGNYLATQRNFSNGFTTDSSKTGTSYVRAIRAF
jgi:lysozyme family protein